MSSLLINNDYSLLESDDCVIAHHFVQHDFQEDNDPIRILNSFIAMFCDNINGYQENLELLYDSTQTIKEILVEDIQEVFDLLILKPIKKCHSDTTKLIVIDALDEFSKEQLEIFLELLSTCFIKLPSWIKIFTTTREYPLIMKYLSST